MFQRCLLDLLQGHFICLKSLTWSRVSLVTHSGILPTESVLHQMAPRKEWERKTALYYATSSLVPQSGHFFYFLFPDCSCNFLATSAKDFETAPAQWAVLRRKERNRGDVTWWRDKPLQVHASLISSTKNPPKHTSPNFYGALSNGLCPLSCCSTLKGSSR